MSAHLDDVEIREGAPQVARTSLMNHGRFFPL
jgi:hypothetical protein